VGNVLAQPGAPQADPAPAGVDRLPPSLIRERTGENQRCERLLEDPQVQLSSVISDIFGVSGRPMFEALIAGQRDPKVLAAMARGSMRSKIGVSTEALTGHFDDHHAFLAQTRLRIRYRFY
jgi:hypothetical protein